MNRKSILKLKLVLFAVFVMMSLSYSQSDPYVAPQSSGSQQAFALKAGKGGISASSINLYTGDAEFPVSVASLPGRGGMDVNLAISYNSNVQRQANVWNVDAPTGVAGLGWSFDYPKIIVDNKMTGSLDDDTYYTNEGGAANELVYVGTTDGVKEYKSLNYQFWNIKFEPSFDKWTITKEDGTKYVYGDNNSGRSTVQWIVSWKNWIGPVKDDNPVDQAQKGIVWNLSEVVNLWGESIQYTYTTINQKVGGSTGLEYTQACYLTKIRNMFNYSINLTYDDKVDGEYVEQHAENGVDQIDPYQERYERKFLDYVTINDSTGVLLAKTDLNYELMGTGKLAKRLLTSIVNYNSFNNPYPGYVPGYNFTYITSNSSNQNFGALSTVQLTSGAVVKFDYEKKNITRSKREFTVEKIDGYAEPKVWINNDYVVVTRRQLDGSGNHTADGRTVKLQVFMWDGEWIEWNFNNEVFENIRVVDDQGGDNACSLTDQIGDYQQLYVTLEKDFFAIAYRPATAASNTIKIYRKDKKSKKNWTVKTFLENSTANFLHANYSLVSGERYVAFAYSMGNIQAYVWNGTDWITKIFSRNVSKTHNEIEGGTNYIISHRRGPSDFVEFHFLKEDLNWSTVTPSMNISTSAASKWYAGSTFAFAVLDGYFERIYHWDENYNFWYWSTGHHDITTTSPVNIIGNNIIGIYVPGSKIVYFGYSGGNDWEGSWISSGFSLNSWGRSLQSYGNDYLMYPLTTNQLRMVRFMPHTSSPWSFETYNSANKYLFFAGRDYFVSVDQSDDTKANLYWRQPDGNFLKDPVSFSGLHREDNNPSGTIEGRYAWHGGHNYLIKSDNRSFPNVGNLQSFKFINGTIGSAPASLNTSYTDLGGNVISLLDRAPVLYELDYYSTSPVLATENTLVTFLSEGVSGTEKVYQKNAKALRLFRLIDAEAVGYGSDFPVKSIDQYDGDRATKTSFSFDASTAFYDQSGTVVQYNKATIYPGSGTNSNGRQEVFFFNGLTQIEAGNFPAGPVGYDTCQNLVKGFPYLTKVYNSANTLLTSSESAPIILTKNITGKRGTEYYTAGRSYYMREHTTRNLTDGILTETVAIANTNNGMPSTVTESISGDVKVAHYKYWYEEYDTARLRNILHPVIQTKVISNGVTVGSTAAKYKGWGTNLVPSVWKTYQWKRTGSADFTSWSESANPTGDWKLAGSVDVVNINNGQIMQTTNDKGYTSSVMFDPGNKHMIAKISNAPSGAVLYESFEYMNNSYVTNTDAKGGLKSYRIQYTVNLPSPGTYKLTYWRKNAGSSDPWVLIEQTVSSNTAIGSPQADVYLIDEIRLYPETADVVTYAYDVFGNLITECDANHVYSFWEYDEFNRLKLKRDKDKNIVKHFTHKVKGQ